MSIPKLSLSFLLVVVFLAPPINGFVSRKLDEAGLPGSTDPSVKCGGCSPCGGATCYLSPPPPPPQYLPPPPPPPPKKSPSTPKTGYCPPPPYSPGIIYLGAPPGSLYPIDQTYSGSTRNLAGRVSGLFGYGLLSLSLMILWL